MLITKTYMLGKCHDQEPLISHLVLIMSGCGSLSQILDALNFFAKLLILLYIMATHPPVWVIE